jgi:hypothetical protein
LTDTESREADKTAEAAEVVKDRQKKEDDTIQLAKDKEQDERVKLSVDTIGTWIAHAEKQYNEILEHGTDPKADPEHMANLDAQIAKWQGDQRSLLGLPVEKQEKAPPAEKRQFKSAEEVKAAYEANQITKNEAMDILKAQFPEVGTAPQAAPKTAAPTVASPVGPPASLAAPKPSILDSLGVPPVSDTPREATNKENRARQARFDEEKRALAHDAWVRQQEKYKESDLKDTIAMVKDQVERLTKANTPGGEVMDKTIQNALRKWVESMLQDLPPEAIEEIKAATEGK